MVRAICVLPNGDISPIANAIFTRVTLRKADQPQHTLPDLTEQYYESLVNLDNLAALTPVSTSVSPTFSIATHQREENFAFKFTGYIYVPKDGIYTFSTLSDDGSDLYIDDALVVDNGNNHGMSESSGNIALAAGQHSITVTYFQGGGSYGLEVRYAGGGITKQLIPASVLSH